MTLSDIAAGLEVTASQRERGTRGVAVADDTDVPLVDRLADHADALPDTPEAVATLVDAYTAGTSVDEAAGEAGVAPMTAAKALHRCGVDGVCPLPPARRSIVRDWLDGQCSRSEALALAGGDSAEFALATYVETHDPIPEAVAAVDAALAGSAPIDGNASGRRGGGGGGGGGSDADVAPLGDALGTPDDLR
ncbi:hypothetical protein JCM17823_16620 [Halorubrum gandharaense]